MTEADTSRNKLHRLIGQLSHDYACDLEREASDAIVALLARAEKAEAENQRLREALEEIDMRELQYDLEEVTDISELARTALRGGTMDFSLTALTAGDKP